MFTILILSFSLSIDALAIGLSYGIRKIKIPISALSIISLITLSFVYISVFSGKLLLSVLTPTTANILGILLLIFLGIWIIYQGLKTSTPKHKEEKTILNLIIKSMGITIKIIRTPEYCDMNNSNIIEPSEALYLGIALSIDSIGVGISTSVLGFNINILPFAVCIFQMSFLIFGSFFGKKLSKFKINSRITPIISGGLLILIALMRCFI